MKEQDVFKGNNTPKDYIVIRSQIVHVKKRLGLFYTEKQLGFRVVIPNTKQEAAELMAKILVLSDDYAKTHYSKSVEVKP